MAASMKTQWEVEGLSSGGISIVSRKTWRLNLDLCGFLLARERWLATLLSHPHGGNFGCGSVENSMNHANTFSKGLIKSCHEREACLV